MSKSTKTIFDRLLKGQSVSFSDPEYYRILEEVEKTRKNINILNKAEAADELRAALGHVIGATVHKSTGLFPPFHVNYGKNIKLGKHVFINMNCTFLDLGGITIENKVLIAPGVQLLSEGHPLDPKKRKTLDVGHIHIKQNSWIGANATILPGVTVGVNSVVAAGAIVSTDVPANTFVGGVPAKILKEL